MKMSQISVQTRWETLRDSLLAELKVAKEIVIHIPGWRPVSIDEGLHWARSSIYEAFYVAYKVQRSDTSTIVWMKIWEFGQNEPVWSEISN
jgi:hypothetical protein